MVFLVTENAKWNVQSVYDAFECSPAFEPAVLTFPGLRASESTPEELVTSEQANFEFFRQRGMNVAHGYEFDGGYVALRDLGPDIVFYEQPHQFLPAELWVEEVGSYALPCYVGYGIMIANIQQLQFNRAFHHAMWQIFAETELHKDLFARYSLVGDANVFVTGHPKLDAYVDDREPDVERFWGSASSAERSPRRLIWAPHFSIKNREVAFSTFHKYYSKFLELARTIDGIEWVVKPHPWLRQACVKYGLLSKPEVDAYFDQWNRLPNAKVYEEGDYFDLFRSSDALVTDCVSFVAEYMPTRKPMLCLVNQDPPLVGFNEAGDRLYEATYKARNWQDIESFIQNTVLGDHDPMLENRRRIAEDVLIIPTEGAGVAIRERLARVLLAAP